LPEDYGSKEGSSIRSDDNKGQAYQEYIKSSVLREGYENGIKVKPLGEIRRKHESKNQSL